jgi:acetyltransferase-like isoleucine patch superfamily enzyme
VVRSNIPADAVVMGNPARVVKRNTPPDGKTEEKQAS